MTKKTPVWPESPSKTADATTDMTGLGNSGWLKGESRWKPPRVAAAAVDMKQPVVEEEAQRRAAKCKH